ncbi:protein of unknown function (plasmid) [Cupriavidus neocaledonicus]|uniref:Uncharacterized protein n=1 Tax=Cupriavidus neocaledonicus TaxID=1040979 RepID=A0A375HT21_9BURK|nr:protein of unknown function [Cupriavidus neocaledonicus]
MLRTQAAPLTRVTLQAAPRKACRRPAGLRASPPCRAGTRLAICSADAPTISRSTVTP